MTQPDQLAKQDCAKLGRRTALSDPDKALKMQNQAPHAQTRMLAADVPVNENPATVRKWWDGLTPKQRKDMMRAEPVLIANLDGIPPDVQTEMRGNGKYDRVKLVQYALDSWNKDDPTDFGNNCTNFVSNALHASGMKEKTSPWGRPTPTAG
ncbi:amidase domain-containing protein [Streptomyces beihaiensis]|uniref:Amidase domain-containing protein n=1 Tax=Streptomyces beihaiensis TaxID=2984495 RepID=A0ABT3TXJ1_9ACTN|nr:amidase domain-containing protein [Streptomyces beihaiensis]MCX3061774.1 amidase domain-containing protein [Streptomyces beihaiensis]